MTMPPRLQTRAASVAASLALLIPAPGHAARPMITDDARIVDPHACQVETWVRRNDASTEYWAVPACNPTGNLELAFGGSRTNESGATHTTDVLVQAKTIVKPLETNGWGIGLAVGRLRHPDAPKRSVAGDLYGYVPLSISFADDAAVLHANAGLLRPEGESRHRVTSAVGAEIRLHERLFFIPEVFHQEAGRPQFQAGLRLWIVPQRLQVDATYGDSIGGRGNRQWFSIGLRVISPPL
jgi:hypothetical protein